MANPLRSKTTFTAAGSCSRDGASGTHSVADRADSSSASSATASPTITGSSRGSSPWMFSTMSPSNRDAASATLLVPSGWSGEVRTASPPNDLTASTIRSSSVATTSLSSAPDAAALS